MDARVGVGWLIHMHERNSCGEISRDRLSRATALRDKCIGMSSMCRAMSL